MTSVTLTDEEADLLLLILSRDPLRTKALTADQNNLIDVLAARLQDEQATPGNEQTALQEARMWARHGYELGQRYAYWTDPGTAPEWLTGIKRRGNA